MATLTECDRAAVIYAVAPWAPGSPAFIARVSSDESEPVEARAIGASRFMGVAEAMDSAAPQHRLVGVNGRPRGSGTR